MKRLIKMALAGTILSSTVLIADTVFDLGAQQLYYPITKLTDNNGYQTIDQYREASYDVGTAVVSTGLASVNGYYRPKEYRNGYFGVMIKEPKLNAAVTFGLYCYLSDDGCSIELLGENGQALSVDFRYYHNNGNLGSISVAGTTQYGIGNYETNINGTIEIDASSIHIVINGSHTFDIQKTNFKLAKINLSLSSDDDISIYQIDKLTSLSISTSD